MSSYTENDLQKALQELKSGVSQRQVAKMYGIPRSTLQNRMNGTETAKRSHEYLQNLTPIEEGNLCQWIIVQDALGLSPTHQQVREIAQRVMATHGNLQPLGKRWLEGFFRRNPDVRTLRSKSIDSARLNGATTEVITAYFQRLDQPLIKGIRQENRWNTDEHGLLEGQGSNGLVLGHSAKKIAIKKQPGSRCWTTIIECISATGRALPPLVIFKGNSVQAQWFEDTAGLADWRFSYSKNGWTSNALALEWLQDVFIPLTRPQKPKEYRLLVVDGHGSHTTDDFMYECFKNNIHLSFLPAHTSHVLQPLDLAVFSPLKAYYRAEIAVIGHQSDSTPIGKVAFLKAYQKARKRGLTLKNITSGWKASGLWPINPAKPLMSRLVVKPLDPADTAKKAGSTPNNTHAGRSFDLLRTPTHSGDILKISKVILLPSTASSTRRLLFRKIGRGIDSKTVSSITDKATIQALEDKIRQLKPKRRVRVIPDPDKRFSQIGQVMISNKKWAARWAAEPHDNLFSTDEFESLLFEWQLP